MAAQASGTPESTAVLPSTPAIPNVYQQGIVAGVLGAVTIAVWFFLLDVLSGRPYFYTPNLLGTALFQGVAFVDPSRTLAVSFERVLFYTWVHGLVFCVIGGLASKLLAWAERDIHVGFGVLLLFVFFEFGFVGAAWIFAEPILRALAWPSVLVGNLLAAAVMAVYFRRRHAGLTISP
jgi:hypothetical protein